MIGGSTSSQDNDPLGPVVESFLARFRRGERPSLTDLIARDPALADRIRELIPALVELEHLGGSTGSVTTPPSLNPAGAKNARDDGPPPERLGDYLILRSIGGGGMGMVYEAEHESLKSRVALKVMHPRFRADSKFLRRFHAEARLAAGLHHTNIVSVFDYGEQNGVCYYAMQFIQGQPLDLVLADIHRLREEGTHSDGPPGPDAIRTLAVAASSLALSGAAKGLLTGRYTPSTATETNPPTAGSAVPATVAIPIDGQNSSDETQATPSEPPPEPRVGGEPSTLGSSSLGGAGELRYFREIARIGAQVADALQYAHRRGVLHRDIKPSNLLLDALGNVWVTDFGLAKLEEGDNLTQSHELIGTLRYMAPERFRGTSDRRGDVYSLGATLYELLTLRPPFEGSDQIRLIERIRDDPPAPPRQIERHVPRDLETIVLKALSKDPKDRFGSAADLADELRRFVEGRPIRSRPVSVAERFWRWCKRERRLAAASIAAAVLTVVLALGSTWAAFVYRGQARQISEDFVALQKADFETQKNLFQARVAQASGTRLSRRQGQRFDSLNALKDAAGIARTLRLPREDFDRLRDEAIACLALPDLEPIGRVIIRPPGEIRLAFDANLTRYAVRFRGGAISVRRYADDEETARFQTQGDGGFWVFSFSPDGRYLASSDAPSHALKVWDIDRRALAVSDPGPLLGHACFSPDSRWILLSRQGKFLAYDLATGQLNRTWPGQASHLAFRSDGAQVAVTDNGSKPPTCRILETESGRLVQAFPLRSGVDWIAWSPDGGTLATTGVDSKIDLWDAATGIRRATLEGLDNHGLAASFHPSGALLASDGFERRLRLWDPILGRPLLNSTGGSVVQFSPDGRIVVDLEDKLTTYHVDPALEFRTFAHASRERMNYACPSIRHDGRVLAVGTDRGAILWDLAHGNELAYLPIGNAWHLMFEPSGDLLTNGDVGVQRWPIRIDAEHGEFRIGPPLRLPLPASHCAIGTDRSGHIVAAANHRYAHVLTPERRIRIGPLTDCRGVAVSPDGQWLATGSHSTSGVAQVWRIADGTRVAEVPVEGTGVVFSPDGKWLMTVDSPARLWDVSTWQEVRSIGGWGRFAPDGRLAVAIDPTWVIRLVEIATGRTLARLESPDLRAVGWPTFSPDGSRLVVTTNDGPAAFVWELRAIRKHLAGMGLDWDAPAYSEDDPANPSAPPLTSVQVDYGPVARHLEHLNEPADSLLRRNTARIQQDPSDVDAYYHRARALSDLRRAPEAIADLDRAIVLRPDDTHIRSLRGAIYLNLKDYEPAIAELETALKLKPDQFLVREWLALGCNNRAWEIGNGPAPQRDFERALALARRAVDLNPDSGTCLNTMGVVLYRAGRYDEAIAMLERSRAANRGAFDGFDLFFLAMAHQRLGHRAEARDGFDRAVRWMRQPGNLVAEQVRELEAFRAEAEAVLTEPPVRAIPSDVFAPVR
jgi:eukaryotic-like serine/threonine-protein kinase